jgi:hypothetical protein
MSKSLPATPLFNSNGVPSPALRKVLEICQINETDFDTIVEVTQKNWRKKDVAAANVIEEDGHLRTQLLQHFRSLGLVGSPPLGHESGQWSIILGATYAAIHKRAAHAAKTWMGGIRWTNTAILVSKRKLFTEKQETAAILAAPVVGGLPFTPNWKLPETLPAVESDLPAYIRSQVGDNIPWNRDTSRFHTVVASDKAEGGPAGTAETLRAFAEQLNPGGTNCFVFSSQPYVLRAIIETQLALKGRFTRYFGTGYDDRKPETINVTQTLDELAKLIFTLHTST